MDMRKLLSLVVFSLYSWCFSVIIYIYICMTGRGGAWVKRISIYIHQNRQRTTIFYILSYHISEKVVTPPPLLDQRQCCFNFFLTKSL